VDTAGRPGDVAGWDRKKDKFEEGTGWSNALEARIKFFRPKEWHECPAKRQGNYVAPVPLHRIRKKVFVGVSADDVEKMDTFAAIAAYDRKLKELEIKPEFEIGPAKGKKAKATEYTPGALVAERPEKDPRDQRKKLFSIGPDTVSGMVKRHLVQTLKMTERAYCIRGDVESLWEASGFEVADILARSRHKYETFQQHYRRAIAPRQQKAIENNPFYGGLSMEEVLRL